MRAFAPALVATAGILVVSGCGGSGARKPTPRVASRPRGVVARTVSFGEGGPLVVALGPQTMRSLKRHLHNARFLSPTRLAIPGIAGSSNCPSVPVELTVRSPHSIRIDMAVGSWRRTRSGLRVRAPHPPRLCLDDLVPSPVVILIDPTRIDVYRELSVDVYYPRGVVRRYRRPVVFTVPPLATDRVREEVRVARASNGLFSIFPAAPGTTSCAIPRSARPGQDFHGICRTSVRSRRTIEPSESVSFTESWWPHCPPPATCSPRTLRHHTWEVVEGETIVRPGTKPLVYAVHSRGATAPQHHG